MEAVVSTLKECLMELMCYHSKLLHTINLTAEWNSSSQDNQIKMISTSSLAHACVSWQKMEQHHPMVSCHKRAGKSSLHTTSLWLECFLVRDIILSMNK